MSPELPVRILPPWIEYPFRLITWMEILEFSASRFIAIASGLSQMDALFAKAEAEEMPNTTISRLREMVLPKIRSACDAISLTMSVKSIDRLFQLIERTDPRPKFHELKTAFAELNQRIADEIGDNLFLFIPKTHVDWYKAENLFGDSVQQAFPSTSYDIREAGKCLALRRNTAAVCHLMRVLEIGLRALAIKLKVQYDNKPWNYVIEVADKSLKKVREAKRKPKNWKQDEKFYSEAIAHFRFMKDAWRNYSMHVYERYDEEQAESVFNHTKAFMRHLATKLKEPS